MCRPALVRTCRLGCSPKSLAALSLLRVMARTLKPRCRRLAGRQAAQCTSMAEHGVVSIAWHGRWASARWGQL